MRVCVCLYVCMRVGGREGGEFMQEALMIILNMVKNVIIYGFTKLYEKGAE